MCFREIKLCIQYIYIYIYTYIYIYIYTHTHTHIFPLFTMNISIFPLCDTFLNNIIISFYLSIISVLCAFIFTLFLKHLKERGGVSIICGLMALDEYFKSKLQKSLRNLCNRCMFIIQCLQEKIEFSTPEVILVNII